MGKRSKRYKEVLKGVDLEKAYKLEEAVDVLKGCTGVKFDQSVEFALKMGVDPRKSDQQIRSTVMLPHGTGKKITVLVFTKGDKVKEALDAGAEYAGHDEFVEKVKQGWTDFDVVIATPDMMREVGKLGKVLGPRGLMPTPKAGTVTPNVAKAITELKKGKIEFRIDKSGVINNLVGKISFAKEMLIENMITLLSAIIKAKPPTAKGSYLKSLYLSSTMGPGLKIDLSSIPNI